MNRKWIIYKIYGTGTREGSDGKGYGFSACFWDKNVFEAHCVVCAQNRKINFWESGSQILNSHNFELKVISSSALSDEPTENLKPATRDATPCVASKSRCRIANSSSINPACHVPPPGTKLAQVSQLPLVHAESRLWHLQDASAADPRGN